MKVLELIGQLIDLHKAHGNIEVILQADQEGNSYDGIRGADYTFVDRDYQQTYDSQDDAEECGEVVKEVIVVYP
jgi:hypothetical protein